MASVNLLTERESRAFAHDDHDDLLPVHAPKLFSVSDSGRNEAARIGRTFRAEKRGAKLSPSPKLSPEMPNTGAALVAADSR
jgi:hypothetical protein